MANSAFVLTEAFRPLQVNEKDARGQFKGASPVAAAVEAPVQAIAVETTPARNQQMQSEMNLPMAQVIGGNPTMAQAVRGNATMAQGSAVYYDGTSDRLTQLRADNQRSRGLGILGFNISRMHLTGQVIVPKKITRAVGLNDCVIDLTQAQFIFKDTFIRVVVVLGGCKVILPQGVHVVMNGIAILGRNHEENSSAPPAAGDDLPTLHIRAVSILGSVHVQTDLLTSHIVKLS